MSTHVLPPVIAGSQPYAPVWERPCRPGHTAASDGGEEHLLPGLVRERLGNRLGLGSGGEVSRR